jgi:S1-C subfamily serine protease
MDQGALITPGSDRKSGDQAGLQAGDVITAIDDEEVTNIDDIDSIISPKTRSDSSEHYLLPGYREKHGPSVTLDRGLRR